MSSRAEVSSSSDAGSPGNTCITRKTTTDAASSVSSRAASRRTRKATPDDREASAAYSVQETPVMSLDAIGWFSHNPRSLLFQTPIFGSE